MKYNGVHLLAASAVLAAASGALARNTEDPVIATIEGDRSAVIVFLPPSIQDPRDRKAVESAIESSKRCLGAGDVTYQTVSADRIVVRSNGREETFEVRDFAPLVGALLLRPGSNARILFAGGGPEALAQMLRFSASEYFGRPCRDQRTASGGGGGGDDRDGRRKPVAASLTDRRGGGYAVSFNPVFNAMYDCG